MTGVTAAGFSSVVRGLSLLNTQPRNTVQSA